MPYAYDDPCIHEQCLDTLAGWRGRVASAASQSERIPQRLSNRQSAVRSTGGAGMERSFGASKHSGSSEMGSSWSCKDAAVCANGLGLSDAGQRIAEPWYRRGDADTLTIVPVCR